MLQNSAEKLLTIIYSLCIGVGAVGSITSAIAWSHWKLTLDQCINRNCSCILYGEHTPNIFLGGDTAPCVFVTFGPLFYILFSLALACFHGYRGLFSSAALKTRTIMRRNEAGETIHVAVQAEDSDPLPRLYWIIVSTFTVFWSLYALIHFAIFLDGFYKTCNQYRKTLERSLHLHGTAIPVVHGRLSCQGIFDFMDYMDTGKDYRNNFINTGLDLTLGIIGSCFAWLLFLVASYINIKRSRINY